MVRIIRNAIARSRRRALVAELESIDALRIWADKHELRLVKEIQDHDVRITRSHISAIRTRGY